jgi:hypothetical protein
MERFINELPIEIYHNEILPHIISKCSNCNKQNYFFDYSMNIRMKKYKPIFEDDFYIYKNDDNGSIYFKNLCNKCYVSFLNKNYFQVNK